MYAVKYTSDVKKKGRESLQMLRALILWVEKYKCKPLVVINKARNDNV